jgi:hypothetical protein
MPSSTALGFALLITLTTAAGAQHAPIGVAGPRPSEVFGVASQGPLRQSFVPDSVRREIGPTHWKKGALIGGVVTGLGLALWVEGICRSSESDCDGAVPAAFLMGGALGGLIGALIGGQFPKAEDP